ncbi:helix-turn-helix domain-containing protein [Streptomyces sp. NPDC059916]|uniref:helix-turn-helix domain-containing protein n=1 Tax=Streptomyces sp. NPDC059916 TaxID=3347001 RepID=UPI0036B82157
MRHPQGGGLTTERQQFRKELGLRAEGFARGEASSVTAEDLRVSVRSVQRWRQMWDEGGPRALRHRGRRHGRS